MSKPPEVGPNGKPIWGRNDAGQPICNALLNGRDTRGSGERCRQTNLEPNGRCRLHAGRSTGPTIVHGRRSKALRKLGLARKFNDALSDPDLASHAANIATLDVLINDRLEASAPTVELWRKASSLYETAIKDGCTSDLLELGGVLKEGIEASRSLEDAVRLMDEQRKHKLAESKREAELETSVSQAQMRGLTLSLIAALEEISDKDERRRFWKRVAGTLAQGDRTLALPG